MITTVTLSFLFKEEIEMESSTTLSIYPIVEKLEEFLFSDTMKNYCSISVSHELLSIENQIRSTKTIKTAANPLIWGKMTWLLIHFMTMDDCPLQISKKAMLKFIKQNIIAILPCKLCRIHSIDYLKRFKCTTIEKNLFEFFIDFHSYVNKEYTASTEILSREEAIEKVKKTIKKMKAYLSM